MASTWTDSSFPLISTLTAVFGNDLATLVSHLAVLSTGHVELNLASAKKRILSLMKPYELDDLLTAIGNVTAA